MSKSLFPKKINKKKGKTVMAAMIDLRKLIEEVLVPGIQEIRLKVSAMDTKIDHQGIQLNGRMDQLNTKIDSFREEFRTEIRRLDQRIDSLEERFNSLEGRFNSLEKQIQTNHESLERQMQATREDFKLAISIHERLAAVEARIAAH